MASHRIRGPFGRELVVEVPGPGLSEVTFKSLVDSGEWEVIPEPEPTPPPRKRTNRKSE